MKRLNLIGKIFEKLTVIEFVGVKDGHARWLCLCDCGNKRIVRTGNLTSQGVRSCGCLRGREKITLTDAPKFIGKRFERLLVIGFTHKKGRNKWNCICDCGKKIQTTPNKLFSGHTKSCGCLHDETIRKFREPGESGALKLFKSYQSDAKKRKIEFKLNYKDFKKITSNNCTYCGLPPKYVSYIKAKTNYSYYLYNGIDRIDSSKGYYLDNVETCCKICNTMKWDLSKKIFLKHLKRMFKFLNF